MMEPNKNKLKLSEQERNRLTPSLIALGEDLLNNEYMEKENIIKLYLHSQQNLRIILQRIENSKNNRSVSLQPETLEGLREFITVSRKHVFAGGARFEDENEAVAFLVDVALKFGYDFLEKMLDDENFKNVTFTTREELGDTEKRNVVTKVLEGEDENGN